jgi:hypothetical protein
LSSATVSSGAGPHSVGGGPCRQAPAFRLSGWTGPLALSLVRQRPMPAARGLDFPAVLDVSSAALRGMRQRLGARGAAFTLIESDVTCRGHEGRRGGSFEKESTRN